MIYVLGAIAVLIIVLLIVIALQRSGAENEARGAAKTYLGRFPSGFRRAEIEALLRP